MSHRVSTVRLIGACIAFLPALASASPAEPIRIQGSTTFNSRLLKPFRQEIEKRAGVTLDVIANKSIHGLVALLEGRARLAMISSRLDGEVEHLRRRYPDLAVERLKSFEVARTRVAFVTHPAVSIRRISLEDLAAILTGKIKRWDELGGPVEPITVVTVQPGGGVPTTVRGELLKGAKFAAPRIVEVEAPSHVLKITAQVIGALGITQLGLASKAALPELQLEGRIEQELNLVTLDEPADDLKAVIEACQTVAAEQLD